MGHLGANLGLAWAILAPSCAILGRSGAILKQSWGFSGGAGPPKTLIFLTFVFKVFALGLSSLQLRLSILSCVILSSSWALLGSSRGSSGPPWGHLRGHLGAVLEPSWAILGHLGAILEPSWAILNHLGAILGPSWAILGPSWKTWSKMVQLGSKNQPKSSSKNRPKSMKN